MSDPRVTGTFMNTFNHDCFAAASGKECVTWGTYVMDGPEGGWDCSYAGTNDPIGENDGLVLAVCPGTGGYEGLTYVFYHVLGWSTVADLGDGTTIRGVVYEGQPPFAPMPSPASK